MELKLLLCIPTWSIAISQLSIRAPSQSHLVTFPWLQVNRLMKAVSAPGAPSIERLQVLVQSHSIMASKFISKLGQSRLQSASRSLLNHGLQTYSITTSQFAPLWPSKCISKLPQLRPPSWQNYCPQLNLQTCSITASKCISEFARSSSSGAPQIAQRHLLQPVQIYCLQMDYYIDTSIHRYIDDTTNWLHEFWTSLNDK